MESIHLICMRLIDMHKVHPQQVTQECALCGEKVGVYPSGQKALRLSPGPIEIMCQVCAIKDYDPNTDTNELVGSINEIVQEVRDSTPIRRA